VENERSDKRTSRRNQLPPDRPPLAPDDPERAAGVGGRRPPGVSITARSVTGRPLVTSAGSPGPRVDVAAVDGDDGPGGGTPAGEIADVGLERVVEAYRHRAEVERRGHRQPGALVEPPFAPPRQGLEVGGEFRIVEAVILPAGRGKVERLPRQVPAHRAAGERRAEEVAAVDARGEPVAANGGRRGPASPGPRTPGRGTRPPGTAPGAQRRSPAGHRHEPAPSSRRCGAARRSGRSTVVVAERAERHRPPKIRSPRIVDLPGHRQTGRARARSRCDDGRCRAGGTVSPAVELAVAMEEAVDLSQPSLEGMPKFHGSSPSRRQCQPGHVVPGAATEEEPAVRLPARRQPSPRARPSPSVVPCQRSPPGRCGSRDRPGHGGPRRAS